MQIEKLRVRPSRRLAGTFAKVVAVALLTAIALPGRAADERAVKQRVPPVYPELAKRMKITGEVKVEATVDADGKVTGAKALSGSKALTNAAEDAVRKWKFAPGSDVSHVDVSVNFEIKE
jgi:TonB family protein